ncbi:antitoxin VbhA family protein [Hymenobacter sp. BT770]|uniref:antitoxin VbhA family protein n=2 Tax=Hymenobacter sp. BT770 TaxID=2886942 RepID=UPI001D105DBA|nr:antitoxin VbhA family protein [Hymenobacter sp. BT770]MCC3152072.1 antitoxin VbhA family protein [Hymenobacter sp. BT770]MDO3415245.1 antitoxin VbhA family protein [Hymenobacter sp. BT770]
MNTSHFKHMPQSLNDNQRQDWLRRQRTAENTLAIQAMGGTEPNEETLHHFQRYVTGEITLAQAIAQVREQMAQEHAAFRQYLNRSSLT